MYNRTSERGALTPAKCVSLRVIGAAAVAAAVAAAAIPASAQIAVRNQGYIPFSDAPINYRSDDLRDPVAKLEKRLENGQAALAYEPEHGYLRSVLQQLAVPIDSQTLVFSKTSFQYPKISPEHPRALYFNDDVYVGSVHEGKAIEVVSFDPMQAPFSTCWMSTKSTNRPFSAPSSTARSAISLPAPAAFRVCCFGRSILPQVARS